MCRYVLAVHSPRSQMMKKIYAELVTIRKSNSPIKHAPNLLVIIMLREERN
jgi:hypothetical protein